MAVGEDAPRLGDEGARRARRWLEATTRVAQSWTNEDTVAAGKLTFEWPHRKDYPTFSFDLGGILKGEPFHNHHFVAESKKYKDSSDQGAHYDNWLAKCYVARQSSSAITDQLMWITWAPFRVTTWDKLLTAGAIEAGLLQEKVRRWVFNTDDKGEAQSLIDADLVRDVADRLWVVVLSDKQEKLVISREHRAWIAEREMRESD